MLLSYQHNEKGTGNVKTVPKGEDSTGTSIVRYLTQGSCSILNTNQILGANRQFPRRRYFMERQRAGSVVFDQKLSVTRVRTSRVLPGTAYNAT